MIDIIFQAAPTVMDGFMGTGLHISTIIKIIFVGSILVAGLTWFFLRYQEGFFDWKINLFQ